MVAKYLFIFLAAAVPITDRPTNSAQFRQYGRGKGNRVGMQGMKEQGVLILH